MKYFKLFEEFENPLPKIENWAKSKGIKFDTRPTSIVLHNIYSKWKYYITEGEWHMNWSDNYSHLDGEQRAVWKEKPASTEEFISTFIKINQAEKIFRIVLFCLEIFEVDLSKQKNEFSWRRMRTSENFTAMVAWSYPRSDLHNDEVLFSIEYNHGKFLMNDYGLGNMRSMAVNEKTGELIEKVLACTFFENKTAHEVVNALKNRPLKQCLEIIGNPPDWERAAKQLRGSIASNKFNF